MKTSKIKWLLSSLLVIAAGVVLAAPITGEQAIRAVNRWVTAIPAAHMNAKLGGSTEVVKTYAGSDGNALFHVVKISGGGYVVTSADDTILPIVAFSEDDDLVQDENNPLWRMLNKDMAYRRQASASAVMANAKATVVAPKLKAACESAKSAWDDLLAADGEAGSPQGEAQTAKGVLNVADVRVDAMLTTKWNQANVGGSKCYNYFTPNNYVCGCVATAGAQLLRYHKFPTSSVAQKTYSCWVNSSVSSQTMMGGVYDWAKMVEVPSSSTTDAQRQAIGRLCYDVGVASRMNWTSSQSGAVPAVLSESIVSAFGYASAKCYMYSSISSEVFKRAIYANLDAGYPVLLGVYGDIGGHAIVADGYGFHNGTIYTHLNLGWGGNRDAWYALPLIDIENINYSSSGSGSTDGDAFTSVGSITFNVFPRHTGELLTGRTLDANGAPIANASVVAVNGSSRYSATSNAKGIYAINVPGGITWTVTASATGYDEDSKSVYVASSESTTLAAVYSDSYRYYYDGVVGNSWGNDFTLRASAAKPDLAFDLCFLSASGAANASSSLAATSFEQGQSVYCHVGIKNQGGGATSGSFVIKHEILNSAGNLINSSTETCSSVIAVGGVVRIAPTLLPYMQNLSVGSYSYRCTLDSASAIQETNKGNNVATYDFVISEPIVTPVSISISGAGSIFSGSKASYVCTALLSDGTTRAVSPIWSISSGTSYASVDEDGVVAAKVLDADHNFSLRASYTLNGVTKTATKTVAVTAAIPIPIAIDNASFTFTTGGDAPWFGQSSWNHDGVDAVRSGPLEDGQTSWMETTVTGPGTLTFVFQTSSESRYDWFRFFVDSIIEIEDSGENAQGEANVWRTYDVVIPSGTHTLRWAYIKDVSESVGYDGVCVDQLTWERENPTPVSLTITGADSLSAGSTTTYTCTALMSDGSSKTVTPAWSVVDDAGYASITASGVLSANASVVDRQVVIRATYTESGVTKKAEKTVGITAVIPMPGAPVIVSAGSGNADAALVGWSEGAFATGYRLYRSATSVRPSSPIAEGLTTLTYRDSDVEPGVEYYYWVSATNSVGETFCAEPKTAYRVVSLNASPDMLTFGSTSGSANATIKANTAWSASSGLAWISANVRDEESLTVTVGENDSDDERTGIVTITAGTDTDHPATNTIMIVQEARPKPEGSPDFKFQPVAGSMPESVFFATTSSDGSPMPLIEMQSPVMFRYAWGNLGTAAANGVVPNTLTISSADEGGLYSLDSEVTIRLNPGAKLTSSFVNSDWEALAPGAYSAYVVLDSANLFEELDETDNGAECRFAVRDPVSLNEALDCDSIEFSTSDDEWFGSNGIGMDGDDGVMTKYLGDGGTNVLTGTFSGAGTLEFCYRVSSEAHDNFLFEIDGKKVVSASGIGDWRVCTCIVDEGDHVATWSYAKDATLSDGADCVFIDGVVWLPESHDPPTDVSATDGESTANVRVTWTKCEGALSYEVGRADSEDSEDVEVLGSTTLDSFPDTTGVGGVRYWYCVRAVFSNGVSDWSLRDEGWRSVTLRISGGSAKTIPSTAGVSSFSIAGNAQWTAVSDSDWLTLDMSEGFGAMKVPFRYDENRTSDQRVATVTITDVTGSVEARTVKVTQSAAIAVGSLVPLNTAADNAILRFTTSGATAWFGQTRISHDGVDALRSGGIPHDTNTVLSTILDRGGTLSFWWGSCCHNLDKLNLYVGGELVDSISGYSTVPSANKTNVVNWTEVTVAVPDGGAVVKWEYLKNKTTASGEDAVFIDQITWSPNGISGHPFGEPVVRDGTPTIFDDMSVTLFDTPAACGDCLAVFDRATDELLTVQRVESDGYIPIFAINGLKANDKLYFKVWNVGSGLDSPEIFTTAEMDDLVIPASDDPIVGFNVNITGTKPTYTVSYDLAGKAMRTGGGELTQSVAFGNDAVDPEISVNPGWLFVGWDCSERTSVRCNMSITALYEEVIVPPETYTVTYDPGANGTGSQQTDTKTENVALTLKGAIFTRDGYTQTGWATSDGGARVYGLGASYTANAAVTLYPFWAEDLDPATIRIDTEASYEAEPDGSFMLDLGELIRSATTPTVTVKGLPTGIKFDSKKVVIAGTATKPGISTVTVSVKNKAVKTPVTATFQLVVPNLRCDVLPDLDPAPDAYGIVMCGVAFDPGLVNCSTSASGWTVKVAGLPTGLKYDAKTGTITGVPTKAGTFTVTFTATKKGEKNRVATITLTTEALPTWATGTFTGDVKYGDDYGSATMTVAANGKVSGKVSLGGTNWTFSATSYSSMESPAAFVVDADAKAGKATMRTMLSVVECDAPQSLINSCASGEFGDGTIELWRNMWKDKATAAAAKAEIAKWEGVYTITVDDGGYFSLTVGKTGDVKASGKLSDGTSVSVTAPLMFHFGKDFFTVFCVSPSAYKGGFVFLPVGFGQERGELYLIGDPLVWLSRNPQATGEYGMGFMRSNLFAGAYYDKLKKLNDYYESLRLGTDTLPELGFTYKLTHLNEANRKVIDSSAETAPAVDTLWQDGLTVTVNGKGAFVVAKATKPVQDKTTKEWSYNGVNDGALTLSFTQATGIFKGSYTFWYDYMSAFDETKPEGKQETWTHTSKKVSFEGVLVQGVETLRGFYLWDATGEYTDPKTLKLKTYKYMESFSVYLEPYGVVAVTVRVIVLSIAVVCGVRAFARAPAPFTLPVRAKIVQAAADGKGWNANGEVSVSFQQARAQFAAKISAAGWGHLHTITLGKDRTLEAWSRENEELTLMIWRIAPGRSGFSYGLSSKAGAGAKK